ncbi:MAG: carbon storage regulator CsrA [Candidatus Aureabacteria bacterium]|nr:carbon storage regulator CsrA [Candidatus Auribacterota bacterium]
MLILQRKKNEAVLIGPDIEIIVTDLKGDWVKLGIKASKSIPVFRKEVYDLIQKQNLAASQIRKEDIDQFTDFLKK